jgi:hypothetical protein
MKLMEFVMDCESGAEPSIWKSMKKSSNKEVDAALLQQFAQKWAEGTSVSGPMCAQKAKFFHEVLVLEGEINASAGWLTRFKRWYDIHKIAVQGERLSSNDAAADTFHTEFQKFVQEENLKLDQIYNAIESGLYWKYLPTKTLAFKADNCDPGHKLSKECLTVMCWGNASRNHKLKIVVLEKPKSRLFMGTAANCIPVLYYNQKGGWIGTFWKLIPQAFCSRSSGFPKRDKNTTKQCCW